MKLTSKLFFLFALRAHAQGNSDGLSVQTQQGQVIGNLASPSVRRFLGVPFATVGRWEVPQLPPIRKVPFIADKFGDSCIQQLNSSNVEYLKLSNTQGINVTSSEDCTSINIWAPSTDRKQKTAVMIWVYGGEFTFGTVSGKIALFRVLFIS